MHRVCLKSGLQTYSCFHHQYLSIIILKKTIPYKILIIPGPGFCLTGSCSDIPFIVHDNTALPPDRYPDTAYKAHHKKYGFLNFVASMYAHLPETETPFYIGKFIQELENGNAEAFLTRLKAFFADIPYE